MQVVRKKYQVASIKYQEARTKNQEINSAWLEILVLALFNVSPLLNSSIGVQYSTLVFSPHLVLGTWYIVQ